jgi:hypothetical protein
MITKLYISLILAIALFNVSWASSIEYGKVKIGKIVAHTVTVNLHDDNVRVTVALARGGTGSSESFKSIIGRAKPAVAITGTFFDTKTLVPTGDIALFGTIVHSGCVGSALCIDPDNRACIVPLSEGRQSKWTGYETVLCAGPRLVSNGKVSIALKHEGFRDSLLAPARRTAVGITESGKLLIVAINRDTSLAAIAKVMVALNTMDAVCLDGGSSTGFYYQGNFLAVPSRQLTNCLVVYSSTERYQSAKADLAPSRYFAGTQPEPIAHFDNMTCSFPVAFAAPDMTPAISSR